MLTKLAAAIRNALLSLYRSEEHLGAFSARFDALETQGRETLVKVERIESCLRNIEVLTARSEEALRLANLMAAQRDIATLQADPRFADPARLERSGGKVHSQFDEDGIIAEIFRRIGEGTRIFVEFGAGDGTENCTAFLARQGWRGLWIEGDGPNVAYIERLWRNEIASGQLAVRRAFITADSIDGVIREAGVSGEIDFLSVDTDGNDYYILQAIQAVAPRVICVEYNAKFPPPVEWVMPRNDSHQWDSTDYYGASLSAYEQMLSGRNYALVGCGIAGVNAFFVRKDLVADKFAAPFTAQNHYHPPRYYLAAGFYTGHPSRR